VSSNDVAGWLSAGTTYVGSGVDYAGDNSITTHSGNVTAFCDQGDSGAYQITGYQMNSADQLTLTWWAKSSWNNGHQNVKLLSVATTSSAYSSLTQLASSTAALNNTGNGGAYTQYTLTYKATAGDAGKYVAVSFTAPGSGGSFAMFDDFNLTEISLPTTPTGLTVTAGDAQIMLNWLTASNVAGYNVKRSTVSGGPYSIVATNIPALSFTNTGLSNGTTYYFVVSATNSVGESMNSVEASAQPVSETPPPLIFGISGSQLQFSWPADHLGWVLQMQTNSASIGLGTNWVDVPDSTTTNQITIPMDPANGSVFFRLISP
jgi:cellulose 1,4-beta-cellobiosidase